MAIQFYSHYVPPPVSQTLDHTLPEPSPKRRKLRSILPTTVQAEKPQPKEKKKKKRQPRSSDAADSSNRQDESASQDVPENTRHQKLLSKRDRSALIASEHAKRGLKDGEGKDEDNGTKFENHIHPERGLHFPEPPRAIDVDEQRVEPLPEWLRSPTGIPADSSLPWEKLLKNDRTRKNLESNGFAQATAIQTGLLPMLNPGPHQYDGDVCIASGTGTGKTLAFMAPMVETIAGSGVRKLRGLVIVPTREIVTQTLRAAELCAAKSGLQIGTTKGSKAISEEQRLLVRKVARYDPHEWKEKYDRDFDPLDIESADEEASDTDFAFFQGAENYVPAYNSKVDILICTPGRLVEHMRSTKGFTLDHVEWLVVDEVDRLLSESYQDWTEVVMPALEHNPNGLSVKDALLAGLPHRALKRRVRKIIASATITTDPDKLAALRLWRPRLVTLDSQAPRASNQSKYHIPATLQERTVPLRNAADKPLVLVKLLDSVLKQSTLPTHKLQTSLALRPSSDKQANPEDETTSSEDESSTSSARDSSTSPEDDSSTSSGDGSSTSEDTSSSGESEDSSNSSISAKDSSKNPKNMVLQGQESILVFTSRNENAMRLNRLLSILRPHYGIGTFTGTSRSSDRRKALADFRRGRLHILIASNLASRSLNIEGLSHVVNYDVPTSAEMYVHRVGRTARAGKPGVATTLLAHHEAKWFWNEIGHSESIVRAGKVQRGTAMVLEDDEKDRYQEALDQLGDEARGT